MSTAEIRSKENKTKKIKKCVDGNDFLFPSKTNSPNWSHSDCSLLIGLVRQYKEDWDAIASHFEDKSPKQCMEKFKSNQLRSKKGNWTVEEDELLLSWVNQKGCMKWTECSKFMNGRCGKQCRERWVNILNPKIKKGEWTEEEQKTIFQYLPDFTTSWSMMSTVLPGRTENAIKNYFYSSLRRLKSNPIIHAIYDIHVAKKTKPEEISIGNTFWNNELSKLNSFTKEVCRFLTQSRIPNPKYKDFLIEILFGSTDQLSTGTIAPFKEIKVNENKDFGSKDVKKKNTTLIGNVSEFSGENLEREAKALAETFKTIAENFNLPIMAPFWKNLEVEVANGNLQVDKKSLRIGLKNCWNCI